MKLPQTKAKCIENVKLNEETGPVKGKSRKKKNMFHGIWHMPVMKSSKPADDLFFENLTLRGKLSYNKSYYNSEIAFEREEEVELRRLLRTKDRTKVSSRLL